MKTDTGGADEDKMEGWSVRGTPLASDPIVAKSVGGRVRLVDIDTQHVDFCLFI
ncbi:hypothetical protein [Saccharibacillus sacchari]|uniref:Uncharacterized protein n=1 Tax=Saccharibacillus sacchari TaxID=456493 RepID=A0ACC6P8A5_9BACL